MRKVGGAYVDEASVDLIRHQIFFCSSSSMAKSKKSKRSRKSSSGSSSSSSSDSDSSSSSSKSDGFSDIVDAKAKKFSLKKRKSGRLAEWMVKGIADKHVKAAREVFKPSVVKDKKYDVSNLFVNRRVDETLHAALKSVKNFSASVANIDPQEKVYRRQTDLVLDMGKPLLFLVNKCKFKKKSSKALALKSLSMLWAHLLRDVTSARRVNILTQTHQNHLGLLSRAADMLSIGGDDLFGGPFIKELLAQVQPGPGEQLRGRSFQHVNASGVFPAAPFAASRLS